MSLPRSRRERTIARFRKYRAALVLLNLLTPESRAQIDADLADLEEMTSAEIRAIENDVRRRYDEVMLRYGVKGTLRELTAVMADDRAEEFSGSHACVPKYTLQQLFGKYEHAHPEFGRLPPHALIMVDIKGMGGGGHFVTFELEASLFEDMASLWNAAMASLPEADFSGPPSVINKQVRAMFRAAAKAAFNFLEGYLNGIAADTILLGKVSERNLPVLIECDPESRRQRNMTLREKIMQYPKLAIGAEHPPVQETSSAAMRLIQDAEVRVRHALIHPSPAIREVMAEAARSGRTDPTVPEYREKTYVELGPENVAGICDAMVDLVEEIARVLPPCYGDTSRWLARRGPDGLFPPDTFR